MDKSVVDLPAPFNPMITAVAPSSTRRSTPCSTGMAPYPVRRSSTSRSGIGFLSQVGRDDLGMPLDLRRGPLGQQLPEVQHVYVVAHPHDQGHVVLDHQDGQIQRIPEEPE